MINKLIPGGVKTALRNYAKEVFGFTEYNELSKKVYSDLYAQTYKACYKDLMEDKEKAEALIPKIDLQQKHIQNLRVLLDREALLRELPQNAVCSELGVNQGDFTQRILEVTKPQKLHLIDAWGDPARYHDGLKVLVREKFKPEIDAGTIEMNVGFSTDILKAMPDAYFDWVYLDTDHTYGLTSRELHLLKDKVKPNGIIAGHDYIIGNWVGDCRYGVIEAVHELCVNDGWELIFITINKGEMPSFAIRRIKN